ncbi:hypothetical protein OXX80_011185 [Metschnikowia pulcherrima]|nr:hypothetical protein OY671_004283 [Metschnikowia pulcherrima]
MAEIPNASETYNPADYQGMVDAILGAADLNTISIKRVKNAISELFNVDLDPHKEEMTEFILSRYYKLVEEREQPRPSQENTEKEDHLMALRLQREEGSRNVRRRVAPSLRSTSTTKVTKRKAPNNAFNAELVLSPLLQEVVGGPRMSRPQVVKQMWVYIRANKLQNPNDKRQIFCDEKLKLVFKKSSVTMFEMNKLLTKHLFKEDELCESHKDREPESEVPDSNQAAETPKPVSDVSSHPDVKTENHKEDLSSEMSDLEG